MHYPKPKENGGILVRHLVRWFQRQPYFELTDPEQLYNLASHPLAIACSGGSDSLALAHCILKYGRAIAEPSYITLLHINHKLRPESDKEEEFLREYAQKMGCKIEVFVWPGPSKGNLEKAARDFRKLVYHPYPVVLTAHHRDDQVETMFWRFCRGESFRGGIQEIHGNEYRPLLNFSKKFLQDFLKEEELEWFEDSTNSDPEANTRAFFRTEVFPLLKTRFPGLEKSIVKNIKSNTVD